MATIQRFPLVHHLRSEPTYHVLRYRNGDLRGDGAGLAFWFRPIATAVAEVPIDDRELHPRTAVGVDHDTGEVLLLVVDGRSSRSRGYTMVELANLMVDLGADEAVNLDGGGSSTMVGRNRRGKVAVLNTPSDGGQRRVANAISVRYRSPAG